MEIVALISFAAIVIAWIMAPDGRATQTSTVGIPVATPA